MVDTNNHEFHDTCMDYQPIEQVREIFLRNSALTEDELFEMDDTEFRARMRERSHHTLEIQLYSCLYRGKPLRKEQADIARKFLKVWDRKGLSHDLPEYKYVTFLVESAEKLVNGETVDLSAYKPHEVTKQMEDDFFTILYERRSVREFKDKDVPDEVIDKVLEAGLWAAHGCNIQSIRYVVVREKNEPGLFRGSDVPGGPVHLVICQDMRCYRANDLSLIHI